MNIKQYRRQIDIIDRKWILLLTKRFQIVKKIQEEKKKEKWPKRDKIREKEIREKAKKISLEKEINPEIIDKLVCIILKYSKKERRLAKPQ